MSRQPYPNLIYLMERRVAELHETLLKVQPNTETHKVVTTRLDALTTTVNGTDYPDPLELLELLASEIRRLKVGLQHERAHREADFMRWRQRMLAETRGKR